MSVTLTFEIAFASNYHVGAGYGRGFGLDSVLLREGDGKPALRGSELAGLLRSSTYQLLKLPPLRLQPHDESLQRLFGTPSQAKRWHIASAHPATLQANDSQAVQRVRIDPRTRRAEPRKLFSQEEGRAGQVFRFTATCPQNDTTVLDEAALLVAAARYTRAIGRARRRGLGECTIHLVDVSGLDVSLAEDQSWEDWFLERFDQVWLHGSPAHPTAPEIKAEIGKISGFEGEAVRVRLIVRLDEPLLIAERASAGNQFDARTSIPGGTVLGVLANLAAQRCNLGTPNDYHDFIALLLRGGVVCPMLYPAFQHSNNLYPTIPAPLGLVTCSVVPFEGDNKGHGDGAYPALELKECPTCHSRLEPVSGFAVLRRQAPFTHTPERSAELHIKVEEETQRVEKGQLYGYTVLDASQYFVGELLCASEDAWLRLQEMTGISEKTLLTWRIGKARRRGYGQVTAWLERCDDVPPVWIQLPLEARASDPGQPLTLTMLTDTVIVDAWGRQPTGVMAEWLEPVLDLGPLEIVDAYARTRVVESFNATLGLPRQRDTALIAGSMAWIQLLAPPEDWRTRIAQLEARGIGLRRNEGYGRVAFNHPIYERREELTKSAIRLDTAMRLGIGPGKDTFVRQWEDELDQRLPNTHLLDPRFAAVARWLHTHRTESPDTLQNQLNTVGQPDSALIEALGGTAGYGARNKANFFQTDGKSVMEALGVALTWLQRENPENWPRGIERLASWVAALAVDKQGGTQ